jgi:hypothetical protein
MSVGRKPFSPCTRGYRHWFTRYNQPGERTTFCQRCGGVNPTCIWCDGKVRVLDSGHVECKRCGNITGPEENPMRRSS